MTANDKPNARGAVTYFRIVGEVTGSGITQSELGQVVGASVRTVQNWARGSSSPSGTRAQRLLDLQYLMTELREAYTDEGVEIWLHAKNRNLGGRRPIDLLTEGHGDEVTGNQQCSSSVE